MKWLRKNICSEKMIGTGLTLDVAILPLLFSLIIFTRRSLREDNLLQDYSLATSDAGKLRVTPAVHISFFIF